MSMGTQLLLLEIFLAFFKEACSITLADQQITLTMYNYSVSWNRAKATCVQNGGALFVEDSVERKTVFETFSQSWPRKRMWIGLHYPITEYNETYGWTDCFSQNLDWFSNWREGHPEFPNNERCAFAGGQFGHWKTKPCDRGLTFVCQTEGGPCTFTNNSGRPFPSSDYKILTHTVSDLNGCLHRCLTEINNFTNCWAVNYEYQTCDLYFTTDPFLFQNHLLMVSSAEFLYKICYFNNGTVLTEDITITAADSPIPDTECVTFNHQITPTTSTLIGTTALSNIPSTVETVGANTTSSTPPQTTSTTASTAISTSIAALTSSSTTSTALLTSKISSIIQSTTLTTSSITSTTSPTVSASSPTTVLTSSPLSTTSTISPNASSTSSTATTPHIISSNTVRTLVTTCQCICTSVSSAQSNLTLAEKLESIRSRLKIDIGSLSSTIRKKTCANDERPSSKSIGLTAICVITIEIILIVMPDLINTIRFFHKKVKEVWSREDK